MKTTTSNVKAAEAAAQDEALKKRAARQAASKMAEPAAPDLVACRVLKKGDGKVSMGVHVDTFGDAFYEHGETFSVERAIAVELEDRGFVEIEPEKAPA